MNAMASEVVFSGMGKIGRLTLLDAGNRQEEYKIKGNPVKQIGFYNRVWFVEISHELTLLSKLLLYRHLLDLLMFTIPPKLEFTTDP